jgi:hypothetical protein
MELELNGGAQFTFSVTHSMLPVGEFSVSVPSTGQGMDRMTVEAHDGLIDILRQLLFRAEKARLNHLRNAARPPDPADAENVSAEPGATPLLASDPDYPEEP